MKTNNFGKKVLSAALALMMILSLTPASLAADADVSVSWNLTNINNPGIASVAAGQPLSVGLSAVDGYILPQSVSVSGATQSTYAISGGQLTIPTADILGDLTVSAAALPAAYSASLNLQHVQASEIPTSIHTDQVLNIVLTADDGYALPAAIAVTGAKYTYSAAAGTLQIPAYGASSDVSIEVTAVEKPSTISWDLTGLAATPQPTEAAKNSPVNVSLSAQSGYELPASVEVTGAAENVSYDSTSGELAFTVNDFNKAVTVKASGTPKTYSVKVASDSTDYITVSKTSAEFKSEVAFTVSRTQYANNYGVESVSVETVGGTIVSVSHADESYGFTMPADDVTVSVVWKLTNADYEVQTAEGAIIPASESGWYAVAQAVVHPVSPATGISASETGPFENSTLSVGEGKTSFYLSDGTSAGVVEKSVQLDATKPVAIAKTGGNELAHNYSNGLTPNYQVVVESSDSGSGVASTMYAFLSESKYNGIVTDKSLTRELNDNEIKEINKNVGSGWKECPSEGLSFGGLEDQASYVLLLKVSDKAGNENLSRYGIVFEKSTPSMTIEPYQKADIDKLFAKKDDKIHLKDGDGDNDSVFLLISYVGNERNSPRDTTITITRDGKNLNAGADYFFGIDSWQWDEGSRLHSTCFSLDIDNKNGTDLPDGLYKIQVEVKRNTNFWDLLGGVEKSLNTSCMLKLSRKTPSLTFTYKGFSGYDGSSGYILGTDAGISEIIAEAEPSEGASSENIIYINSGKTGTISFTSDDIIESWEVTAQKDGRPYDMSKGFTVDSGNKTITIDGNKAAEGNYTLSIAATGFNGCTANIIVPVVVDRTAPSADDVTASGFTTGEEGMTKTETVQNGVWTNEHDVMLTVKNISDSGSGLPINCVAVTAGITAEKTVADGTWTGTISGEQNRRLKITLTDKAGNSNEKTFTARIDTSDPKDIKTYARKAFTDMALIADQFTFGVFHVDYDKITIYAEDEQPEASVVYDKGVDTASGIRAVEYHFLTSNDAEYKELFHYYDGEGIKHYYSQTEVKTNADVLTSVKNNTLNYLLGIEDQTGTVWTNCVRISTDPGAFETGKVSSDLQYIVFLRVWDNAGNKSCFYRSMAITDVQTPLVNFAVEETADCVALEDGSVIYTGAVPLDITVTDPNNDSEAYSGLNKVTYSVCRGNGEVLATGSFGDLPELFVEDADAAVSKGDQPLPEQGINQAVKRITLDDIGDVSIDATNIYIEVCVQDISGNKATYRSDQEIGFINIDKVAPTVNVEFDGVPLNGKYFGANRNAILTIVDANFDPATGIKLDSTGTLGEWSSTVDENGIVTYTAEIVFEDGDHHFIITEVKDKANHIITDESVIYNVTDQGDFIVDTVDPVPALTFSRADEKAFGEYNNSDILMTVTITEHNFSSDGVVLSVTKDGAHYGVYSGWNDSGDNHTASYAFTDEGRYAIDLTVTDLAGRSVQMEPEYFVLDKTAPKIEILNVEDQHAYNGETVTPVIRVTDANYSEYGVDITAEGVHGGITFYDETDIAGGQEFTFENIEDDDIYPLTVIATDEAENEAVLSIRFSVNRNGSVFTPGEEIGKAMENGIPYFKTEMLPPVRVIETNVDLIETSRLYLAKDSTSIDLTEGIDYTVKRRDVNGGWSQYAYELNPELFKDDAVYRINLLTRDAAGNAKNAESVVAFIVDNTQPLLFMPELASRGIYNEKLKHVTFTPSDNLLLSSISVFLNDIEIKVWAGEELAEMLRLGEEFGFDIPESNALQNVKVIVKDAAGNENEYQLFENILVSTNAFVRFYRNKPVFYGTIGGLALLAAGLWFGLAYKKKKKSET